MTVDCRANWAARNETVERTVLDAARLSGAGPFRTILNLVAALRA